MKIDNFLKCKKVRCVKAYGDCLTVGKEYSVLNIRMEVEVRDDEGGRYYWESDYFEPVIDDMPKSAENPLQDMKLTPEFEAVEPKFKVGDRVYYRAEEEIFVICGVSDFGDVQIKYWREDYHNSKYFCHATPENYERLKAIFPDIEFEKPPKPLTGSDLARAMLDRGWVSVPCYISDESDYEADNNAFCALIGKFDKCFKELATNYEHEYAVPFDPRTGEPLTEAVLDE